MFFFGKKKESHKILTPFLSAIETDIHSHLIPGVDDGVPDADTSLRFIRQLQEMGLRKIVTTPHIMMDRYPNSVKTLAGPYQEVMRVLSVQHPELQFRYAAEYYMDEQFELLMQSPLLTLSGRYVLVEVSFIMAPPQMHRWLFELVAQGYVPVLAHPERYNYCHKNFAAYEQFKQWGCLLQVNLLSLTGYYGKSVQQAAEKLMEQKMIDFIGTDLHHDKHMHALCQIPENRKLLKTLEQYPFKNNTLTHLD
ncbi:tyrosine-protein phosphatase [Chitinophaga solisilvae]|uniref:protein-tyrosine-phosphatase n=1 Tax=Chitinophaga solisilvae TaxID=1233460 RepID=A0A3S1BEZ3_9BACT|nr:CpsB/CapC family capsule biosynthesis tyrosine phosphatase [Chitinophaga solisilvae]NSL85471.1 histidinol phosphatase [Chitinophaga solisilvae]